jgi:hypothetical protein
MDMKSDEILWVTNAEYAQEYRLLLTFSDNSTKLVDLKNHLYGEIFEPLKDTEKFKQFNLSDWTVEWENGADYAPEFLYEIGI